MKHLTFLFLFVFGIFANSEISAQTAIGGCDFVKVTSIPSYPVVYTGDGYPGTFSRKIVGDSVACTWLALFPQNVRQMLPLLTLEKWISGAWGAVQGPVEGGVGFTFTNVAPGKYRVKILTPYYNENKCHVDKLGNITRSRISIINSLGQFIGYSGTYDNTPFGGNQTYYTNEVFVGAAQTSDIQWSYIDGDGLDLGTNLFDFNEVVRINTAGTQNYTHWWLAIFELNGAMRYKSTGWNFGAMPSVINLSAFWGQNNWKFENLTSYRVQLAISNQCNAQWTEMSPQPPDFFICPQGSGCRPGDEIVPITLAPNPASQQFSLQNLPTSDVQVHLYDMSGRLVKNYQNNHDGNFDISDINSGIYIVRALQSGTTLYNGKLSVVH
jgi:hypothetical protein